MSSPGLKVGRYALMDRIASGGMATVHLGRLVGSAGFSRTVAVKRLHPHLCEDPAFTSSFADEATLAARIRHPNVVPTLDVVATNGELLIVMEYIDGEALSGLLRRTSPNRIPVPIVVAIVSEMLHGLNAAHDAKSETGKPLEIVHRDISPQNVIVGADGAARLVDFGIARANSTQRSTTGVNDLKGKLAYMAPEQIRRERVDRRTDIFAAGIVLWELLTSERLFAAEHEGATIEKILVGWVKPPSSIVPDLPTVLDDIVLRALDADPSNRFQTARDMAVALEDAVPRALARDEAAWVEKAAGSLLEERRLLVEKAEAMATNPMMKPGSRDLVSRTGPQKPAPEPPPDDELDPDDFAPTVPQRERFSKPEIDLIPEATATDLSDFTPPLDAPPDPVTGPGLPTHFGNEPTVTAFGEEISGTAIPMRSRMDRVAYGIFGAALLVALVVGLAWSRINAAPPPTPAFSPLPPPVEPVQTAAAVSAEPAATAIVTGATSSTPGVDPPKGSAHRVVKSAPAPRPTKVPCVAKLDPATGKKVYQGDCD